MSTKPTADPPHLVNAAVPESAGISGSGTGCVDSYLPSPTFGAQFNMESCLWALMDIAGVSMENVPDIMIVNARIVVEDAKDEDGPWNVRDFPHMAVMAAMPLSTETAKDTHAKNTGAKNTGATTSWH